MMQGCNIHCNLWALHIWQNQPAVLDWVRKLKNLRIKLQKFLSKAHTKLLIAEDTASVRDILQRQLNNIGVEATFVENGNEALTAVRSGEYGILLTDLHMPEMDGYEVIKQIRDDDKMLDRHFPVIALTADVQMNHRQVYMKHGFDECLLKPVSLGQFKRLLVRWGLLNESQPLAKKQSTTVEKSLNSIDKNAIIRQMGSFDDSIIKMLKMFVEMTAPLIENIESAHQQKNINELLELAHSLKGSARSACANNLGNYADKLQIKCESGQSDDSLILKIRNEFEVVKSEIGAL